MKFLKSIRNLRLHGKLIVASLVLAGIAAVPLVTNVTNAGFFPGRPTFDYNKFDPANPDCADPSTPGAQNGRCGSMDGPVFNSFINTPEYGDERYFVDGRRTDLGPSATADTITDVTEGSKQVTIRMYVHNNANQNTNASGKGIAHNTKVSLELPTNSGSALQAVGAISASNATPTEVSDTVYMTANRAFHVEYVPGSAKLYRGNTQVTPLSDSIVNGGALIGDDVMNGDLPGCFDQAALVMVTINIIPEQNVNLQLMKQVHKVGDNTGWHKEVSVKPGEEEQWLLTTKNIGLDQLNNVRIRDILPPHLSLVPGSIKLVNADQSSTAQPDGPLFSTSGMGLGVYPSGGGRFVMFKTKALDDFSGCSTRVRNISRALSNETPNELEDTADVVITKENCQPSPLYSCDLLSLALGANRTATFTTNASASGGAQITMYQYDFGDGTPVLNTDKAVVTHTYAKDGQYAARVKVQVNANGQVQFAESAKCAVAVNFTPTPGGKGPTSLPNTGPADVAGIFGATTAIGAVAHRWMLGRRYR